MKSTIAVGLIALAGIGMLPATHASADAVCPSGPRLAPIIHRGAKLPPPAQSGPVPLVIGLHGSSSSPAAFERNSGLDQVADRYGFVVAYLGSQTPTSSSWTLCDMSSNLAYISSEISQLTASQNIDPSRVYVTGFSAGASMTFFVGCNLSRQVAAIAPVAGAERWKDPCKLSRPTSMIDIIGSADGAALTGTSVLMSVSAVASRWESFDGCSTGPSQALRYFTITESTWSPCNDLSAVASYVIQGGTHTWPPAAGADRYLNASQVIWAFFSAHPGLSASQPSVSLTAFATRRSAVARWLRIALTSGENSVVLRATLSYRGRRVAYQVFDLSRGEVVKKMSIRRTARSGRYKLKLTFTDAYGRQVTIVHTVYVPTRTKPSKNR
jgi:polyhydroxybutyrate depolymerase